MEIKIAGEGGWKELVVSDAATGEVLLEKKFTKSGFGDVMRDPQYKPFVDKVIEAAYVITAGEKADEGESPVSDDDEEAA